MRRQATWIIPAVAVAAAVLAYWWAGPLGAPAVLGMAFATLVVVALPVIIVRDACCRRSDQSTTAS